MAPDRLNRVLHGLPRSQPETTRTPAPASAIAADRIERVATPPPGVAPASPFKMAAPPQLVADHDVAALQLLLRIERDARLAKSETELSFLIANETRKLVSGRQVFLLKATGPQIFQVSAVSSLSGVDRTAPSIRWIERLTAKLSKDAGTDKPQVFALPAYCDSDDEEHKTYPFRELVWMPLEDRQGEVIAGLLVARDMPWSEPDRNVLHRLAETYGHAWIALQGRQSLRQWSRHYKRAAIVTACVFALLAFVPVPISALAPAEVVSAQAFVVAAPIDGIIEEIAVEPNSPVTEGTVLFRFSDTQNRNALEVSERELQVAEAKWRQVTQSALIDPQAKRELAITEAEYRLKQAERDYAKDLLAKSTVRAPKAGLALFSDKRDFVGRPVQAGQRVMEIADPATAELKINVPVEDAIVLGRGARVRVFLDSDPLHAVDANLLRASFAAKIIEGNVLAFRVDAAFKPGQTPLPRLGIRGTAQMLGRDVPLFVLLFRRPISFVRQRLGL